MPCKLSHRMPNKMPNKMPHKMPRKMPHKIPHKLTCNFWTTFVNYGNSVQAKNFIYKSLL